MRKTSRNLYANLNIQLKMKKFDRHDMKTRDISDIFHLCFLPFLVLCLCLCQSRRVLPSQLPKSGPPTASPTLASEICLRKSKFFGFSCFHFILFVRKKKLFRQHLCHKITVLRRTSYFLRPPCSLPSRAVSAH